MPLERFGYRAPARPRRALRIALALLFLSTAARAAVLDATAWKVWDQAGTPVTAATDGRLETVWFGPSNQTAGTALMIDLGRPTTLQRLYLTPGTNLSAYARALNLYIGDTPQAMRRFLERDLPYEIQTNLKFNPVTGRYLRIELAGRGAGYPWAVAEVLAFGAPAETNDADASCVLVDPDAPPLIRFAAEELRYYVGELTGRPLPLVFQAPPPEATGFVLRVTTPPALPPYAAFLRDPRGQHPERIAVWHAGRQVVFCGTTQRATLGSVYEFLDRQGVRWLYPDALGDFVPARGALDLTLLPLKWEPPFSRRYANWNTEREESNRDEYLWYFRNRWNATWNGRLNDHPGEPTPAQTPDFGYTHTFQTVVPGTLYAEHPDWFPLFRNPRWIPRIGLRNLGRRIPYDTTWGLNFCTSSTGVVDYVVQRILDHTAPAALVDTVWLVPMDAGAFCECARCRAQDQPDQPDLPQGRGALAMSNRYFTFIDAVAARVQAPRPNLQIGAFAYEGYLQAPSKFPRLPSNVVVDVVQGDAYQLPPTAAPNRWMADIMTDWVKRWDDGGHVGVYDWALLLGNAGEMPVPMVTALAGRIQTFYRLGVRRIGTQADAEPDVWRYNPWNFYAYSRLLHQPEETPDVILREFFIGYYGRAGNAMRNYYRALEDAWLANAVLFDKPLAYAPTRAAFPAPVLARMAACLDQARADADTWITRQRVADAADGFAWTQAHLPP